jgi:predicted enzyme related to lactoylglutathione lyase
MTHIDKHSAGSFCWIELATTDQNAAKDFYSSLFGWSPQDNPIGPSEFYTVFKWTVATQPLDTHSAQIRALRVCLRTG